MGRRLTGGAFQQAEAKITVLTVSRGVQGLLLDLDESATVALPQLIYEEDFNQR
ncbi:hypothetical protein AF70_00039690 [Pseudomonas sp. KD5]|jgi:hypothetical protein|uniref:Uncharacterized protein n=1 Tax=Pseudomonas umsongensis TaxID=198618 RepID=A0ACC5ME41_9PSED|nr:hypothetical protein [Pseudomonas umsongensis]MDR7107251.1 hypothetical protein [Pseudomonas frederiksbergensis]NMN78391.1 hypothetical protein [Pseudomonas sp. KD5]